eukprot:GHVU01164909.1.p1 GENE.GHVU01164909.1~~GHVU01164909.1.p1  ORF type:complete len:108 (+),score=4.80 GHVU01164909.1:137-460(+)
MHTIYHMYNIIPQKHKKERNNETSRQITNKQTNTALLDIFVAHSGTVPMQMRSANVWWITRKNDDSHMPRERVIQRENNEHMFHYNHKLLPLPPSLAGMPTLLVDNW